MNFNLATYVDVQERINRFWGEYPEGALVTRLMSPPEDFERCRYEAAAYKHKDDGRPAAVGYAFELFDPNTKGPNRTNHEENCETSAIGRALANMGYAKNRDERPSAQEMRKVARAQDAPHASVDRRSPPTPPTPITAPQRGAQPQNGAPPNAPSDKQTKAMFAIGSRLFGARGKQLEDTLTALAEALFGAAALDELTGGGGGTASAMIDYLQKQNGDPDDAIALIRDHEAQQEPDEQGDLGLDAVAAQVDQWRH